MWIWIAVSGALMLVELLTANLLFASLAIAALGAALAAMLGADVLIQGIVFGLASLISLVLLRPIALKHLKTHGTKAATNTDALIGKEAFTLTEVNDRTGQIKLAGEVWSATSAEGQVAADTKVVVLAIRGATAVIKEV